MHSLQVLEMGLQVVALARNCHLMLGSNPSNPSSYIYISQTPRTIRAPLAVLKNVYRWLPEKESTVYEKPQQRHDDGTSQLFRRGHNRKEGMFYVYKQCADSIAPWTAFDLAFTLCNLMQYH